MKNLVQIDQIPLKKESKNCNYESHYFKSSISINEKVNELNDIELLMNRFQLSIEFDNLLNQVNKITAKSIQKSKELKYIDSSNNLPSQIRADVKKLICNKKPILGQCFLYSRFVSSQISGVNQIFGLYHKEEFQKLSPEILKNTLRKLCGSKFFKDSAGKVWGLHSWNEYKGIHFDCMKETHYELENEKEFIKYKILFKNEKPLSPKLSKYFNDDYEYASNYLF